MTNLSESELISVAGGRGGNSRVLNAINTGGVDAVIVELARAT